MKKKVRHKKKFSFIGVDFLMTGTITIGLIETKQAFFKSLF